MKRIIFLLAVVFCSVCLTLPANAGSTITYTKYGGCHLITKQGYSIFGGSWTEYGLAKQGRVILSPEYKMSFNEALRLFVFWRYRDPFGASGYWCIALYSADSGECLYSALVDYEPMIHFTPDGSGKYTRAVLCSGGAQILIGEFFRKNGKTYQRKKQIQDIDVAL
ncbi:MAG: hypothetical protein J6J35_01390 [Alphaproteobacteria bacterium]|nr:hypothetical protein [Alphaproteobacteria bacterium]